MSLARIKKAKEKQVELEAQIQEKKVEIKEEKLSQTNTLLTTERTNSQIANINRKIAGKNKSISQTNYNISIVKDGAAKDLHGYEKASRLFKQHEYKSKLQLAEINLNELIANNQHIVNYNGDSTAKLISPSEIEVPQIEFTPV